MKFEIFGGDERFRELACILFSEGHEVACLAMENAELPEPVRRISVPGEPDCVILPLPAELGRLGALNAPFSDRSLSAAKLLSELPEGTPVFGGRLSERLRAAAIRRGLRVFDCMQSPEFTAGNAEITAEAAVSLCMSAVPVTLSQCSVLVIGAGRIGTLLAGKLRVLGARVTLLSRDAEKRALLGASGFLTASPEKIPPDCDICINTAPARVLSDAQLGELSPDCYILELASAPGGIDGRDAEKLGLRYARAPGLPGKYAPRTAAGLIRDAIMRSLKEQNENAL